MTYLFRLEKKFRPQIPKKTYLSEEEEIMEFVAEERFLGVNEMMIDLRYDMQRTIILITSIMFMIDPYRKKHPHASLVVAGKLSGHPHYRSKEFNASVGYALQYEILRGKSDVARGIAELSKQVPMQLIQFIHNRPSACLSALASFIEMKGRYPTKRELEIKAVQQFPEHFTDMDAKEWRRLRQLLCFNDWMEDGKRGITPSEEISIKNAPLTSEDKTSMKPDQDQDDAISQEIQKMFNDRFSSKNQDENLRGIHPPLFYFVEDFYEILDSWEPLITESNYSQEVCNIFGNYLFMIERHIQPELSNKKGQSFQEAYEDFVKEKRGIKLEEKMWDLRIDIQKEVTTLTSKMCKIDPSRKRHPHASLAVVGKFCGNPYYRSKEFNTALGFSIESEILLGKSDIARDIADLTKQLPTLLIHNRTSACLAAFMSFQEMVGRYPTKKELETEAIQKFPDLFTNMDPKEWRRLRKLLGLHKLLEDGKRGVKKGGKFK